MKHHEESPLHLLTASSLAAVEGLVGAPVDGKGFGPTSSLTLALSRGSSKITGPAQSWRSVVTWYSDWGLVCPAAS